MRGACALPRSSERLEVSVQGGAQVHFHRVAYDWLDKTLAT
jgi:hypothetical protein